MTDLEFGYELALNDYPILDKDGDEPDDHDFPDDYGEADFQEALKVREAEEAFEERVAKSVACPENIPKVTNLEIIENWEARSKNLLTAVPTGFPALDEALGGGIRGLCLMGGMTGIGKTAFALQIAAQVRDVDVYYYSIEMSPVQLTARTLARVALQNGRPEWTELAVMAQRKLPEWLVKLSMNEQRGNGKNLYLSEINEQSLSIARILNDIKRIKENKPDKAIFIIIDYLQIMKNEDPSASKRLDIDMDLMLLFAFCHKYNTSALVISSFNRTGYDVPVGLSSFKESGGIEYSADHVIGLQFSGIGEDNTRKTVKKSHYLESMKKYPRQVEAVVLKSRFSAAGGISKFEYYSANQTFKEKSLPSKKETIEDLQNKNFTEIIQFLQRNQMGVNFPVRFAEPPFPGDHKRNEYFLKQVNELVMADLQEMLIKADYNFQKGKYDEIE